MQGVEVEASWEARKMMKGAQPAVRWVINGQVQGRVCSTFDSLTNDATRKRAGARIKDKFRHVATDYYHLDDRMTQVQRRMHLGLHTVIMVWKSLLVRS